jgi:hypothetical protein
MHLGTRSQAESSIAGRMGTPMLPWRRVAALVAILVVVGAVGAFGAMYLEKILPTPEPQESRRGSPASPQTPSQTPSRTVPSAPPVAPSPGYTALELPRRSRSETVMSDRTVVLCFLSASSGPSIAQLPILGRVADDFPETEVLIVAVGDKEATLSAWLESRGVHERLAARAVPDPGGSEARRWQVTAAPTTFIVRADGIVDWLRVGTVGYDELTAAVRRAAGGR